MAVFGLTVDSCIEAKYGESLKNVKDEVFRQELLDDIKASSKDFIEAKLNKIETLFNNIEGSLGSLTTAGTAAAGTFASVSMLLPSGTAAAVAIATSTKSGFEATLGSVSSDLSLMEESLSELGVLGLTSVSSGLDSLVKSIETVSALLDAIPVR